MNVFNFRIIIVRNIENIMEFSFDNDKILSKQEISSPINREIFSHEFNRIISEQLTQNINSRLNTSSIQRNKNNLLSGRNPLSSQDFRKPSNQSKNTIVPNVVLQNRFFSPPAIRQIDLGIISARDSDLCKQNTNSNFTADKILRGRKVWNTKAILNRVNQMKAKYMAKGANNSLFPTVNKRFNSNNQSVTSQGFNEVIIPDMFLTSKNSCVQSVQSPIDRTSRNIRHNRTVEAKTDILNVSNQCSRR